MILWHNPRCSKSRQTLALLESRGIVPQIRKYLEDTPSVHELEAAQSALGLAAIDMMRRKEPEFTQLGLSKNSAPAALLQAMSAHPKLIERPILFANGKAAIGRPPENVLGLL